MAALTYGALPLRVCIATAPAGGLFVADTVEIILQRGPYRFRKVLECPIEPHALEEAFEELSWRVLAVEHAIEQHALAATNSGAPGGPAAGQIRG